METSGKDLETQRRAMVTQQKIKRLEQENGIYKQRLLELSQFIGIKPELDTYLRKNEISNILEIPAANSISFSSDLSTTEQVNGNSRKLVDLSSNNGNTNGNGELRIILIN